MILQETFESISRPTIDTYLAEGREEDLHLDFKLAGSKLEKDDRRNFAKAVSGFANSDGGLVIWGVDARPNAEGIDCVVGIPGVPDLARLVNKLNEYTGSVTSPAVIGVEHRAITEAPGFAVTVVPASDSGPHMAKLGEDRYYQRVGSSFIRMEHFSIADMFGRRPQPRLVLDYKLHSPRQVSHQSQRRIELALRNDGRGSARSPYLAIRPSPPFYASHWGVDGNGQHGLPELHSFADSLIRFGGSGDIVIHPGTTHSVTIVCAEYISTNIPDLALAYEICVEGQQLHKGELLVLGSEPKLT